MPNTGDATGAIDPSSAAQDVYRAFQDNGVPILGLCTTRVINQPGLPPMVRIQVRLDHGRPVVTDARTLPEGESLPPADSVLTIDLTQANNSIGGYSWYASGKVDNLQSGELAAIATSVPSLPSGWGSLALDDPAKREQWNAMLPQSACAAVEAVKRKLRISRGVVGRAKSSHRNTGGRRAAVAALVALGAGIAGAIVGEVIAYALPQATAAVAAPASAVTGRAVPLGTTPTRYDRQHLDLNGDLAFTAKGTPCPGFSPTGTYPVALKTDNASVTLSIQGSTPSTGTIQADGSFTAKNDFYMYTGRLSGNTLAAGLVTYTEGSATCPYDVTGTFSGTGVVAAPMPTLALIPQGLSIDSAGAGGGGGPPVIPLAAGIALLAGGAVALVAGRRQPGADVAEAPGAAVGQSAPEATATAERVRALNAQIFDASSAIEDSRRPGCAQIAANMWAAVWGGDPAVGPGEMLRDAEAELNRMVRESEPVVPVAGDSTPVDPTETDVM